MKEAIFTFIAVWILPIMSNIVYENPMQDKIDYMNEQNAARGQIMDIMDTNQAEIYEACSMLIHYNYTKFLQIWCDEEIIDRYILDVKNWHYE